MTLSKSPCWMFAGALPLLVAASAFPVAASGQKVGKGKPAPKPLTGEQIFKAQCASCHGAKGEGTEAYSGALTGSQSVAQLSKYIAQSMPPGPKHCSVKDAPKVAAYIYNAFYSPIAQERNRPARVALSRLTVRQFQNVVSDLIGSFYGNNRGEALTVDTPRGLKAEYFKAKRFQDADRVLERMDPAVQFDFGTQGPQGADFNPHQFSIRWQGSVYAPDSGVYEFIVRTEHATRLWVNGRKPVIDASIRSGNQTEFRAAIPLIGGRAYPLRLEFTKSTQGVDDTKQKEGKPAPPASITLAWKRPHMAEETIPNLCLLPNGATETFVETAPFPPDDRSRGYERADTVSPAWDEATTNAALETADYVANHLNDLAGTTGDVEKLKAFCRTFAERALRRPLDADLQARYIDKQFAATTDPKTAVKRVVLMTLKSPRFLYREVGASSRDPYAVASRLAFALWDTLPDKTLLQAAAKGELSTREQVAAQAERMAQDPRAWAKQRAFLLQWLKVDAYPDLAKDAKKFPNFSPAVAADLRTSFDLTLESLVRNDKSDYRALWQSDKVYLNGRLAPLYGVKLDANAPFQPVSLDPTARAGILTHPYLLASFAYVGNSSPIHRGVLLARSILGRTLQPPPAAFTPLDASLHPNLTTRQRVSLQTKPAACSGCHNLINPLGFTLERFDAIGRMRLAENNRPVDSSGSYVTRDGKIIKFAGAQDLGRYISTSEESHAAFVEKLFQYEIKQPIRAYGPQTLPRLQKSFAQNGYNIRKLTAEIAVETALPTSPTLKEVAQR